MQTSFIDSIRLRTSKRMNDIVIREAQIHAYQHARPVASPPTPYLSYLQDEKVREIGGKREETPCL